MHSSFETVITVRPDDIDMNNHVHYSRYLDYLLMARYDQMQNNYKVSMEEFVARGYSWVASNISIQYKRPILLHDGEVIVRTQLETFHGAKAVVNFWIIKGEKQKIAAEGQATYTMITIKNGRPTRLPDDIIEKYSI